MPSFRSALPPVLRPAKTKHTHPDARSIHVPVARAMVDCGVYADGRRLPRGIERLHVTTIRDAPEALS